MRNLLLAFGLFLFPAVVMAAPSNSNCEVSTSTDSSVVASSCTAGERKLIAASQAQPTIQEVDKALTRLMGEQYLVISEVCKLKGGRRKAARSSVERCYRNAGEGQRLILQNALNNLGDIKACKRAKTLGEQINCMIDQNNKLLVPLIEKTLDSRKAYVKGLKFMLDRGCTFKAGNLQCASSAGIVLAAIFMFLLGRIRPSLRMTIGGTCFILGALAQSGYASTPCLEALEKGIEANIKSPSAFIHIASKCHIQYDVKLEGLRSQTYGIEATIPMVEAIVDVYCSKLSGEGIAACMKESRLLLKKLDGLQVEASGIWIKKYEASLKAKEEKKREAKFKRDLLELEAELQKLEAAEAVLKALKGKVKEN